MKSKLLEYFKWREVEQVYYVLKLYQNQHFSAKIIIHIAPTFTNFLSPAPKKHQNLPKIRTKLFVILVFLR